MHTLKFYLFLLYISIYISIHQDFSCVCVCVSVMDVGVAVTNLRVVCKTITCASAFTEMARLVIESKKWLEMYHSLSMDIQ